jgi:hypothetical protein
MTARWKGQTVRVYGVRGDRTQIVTRRGLRWVKTSELETLP